MGLKSEIFFVVLFLGRRTMKKALVLWLITPLLWNSANTLTKSSLITSQQSWNTAIVKPSGPGALSLSIWNMALEISSSVKGASKLIALSSEIGDQSNPSILQDCWKTETNPWYQKLKINQRVENERKRQWHQILMWKPSEEIKNHGTSTMKNKNEYKVLPSSSLPIILGPLD